MKKCLLSSTIIALCSFVYAEDCIDNCCSYEQDCTECCSDYQIYPYVDFLWWYGRGCNLEYGVISNRIFNDTGSLFDVSETIEQLEFSPKWNPGVRVGLEKEFACCVGVFAEWTWYQTNDKFKKDMETPSSFEGNHVFISRFFIEDTEGSEFFSLNSKFSFRFNRVDVGISKAWCFYDCFELKPYLAFIYAYFHEGIKIKAFAQSIEPIRELQKRSIRAKTSYSAYGGTLGLAGYWNAICGFGFHFDVNFSPVGGVHRLDEKRLDLFLSEPATEDEKSQTKREFKGTDGRLFSKVQAAVTYETSCWACFSINAMLGWESQFFLDQSNWLLDDPAEPIICFDEQGNTFSVHGLVARIGIGF